MFRVTCGKLFLNDARHNLTHKQLVSCCYSDETVSKSLILCGVLTTANDIFFPHRVNRFQPSAVAFISFLSLFSCYVDCRVTFISSAKADPHDTDTYVTFHNPLPATGQDTISRNNILKMCCDRRFTATRCV